MNLRLEYYSRIHKFRKHLKEQTLQERQEKLSEKETARTFDFSLEIKSGN